MTMTISKDMLIGNILSMIPDAAELLLKEGVQCVGCGAKFNETLEQGLLAHGRSQSDIDAVVRHINELTPEVYGSDKLLLASKKSITKLSSLLEANQKKALRITVVAGGCSGHQYELELIDEHKSDDIVIPIEQAQFVVDKKSMELLKGAQIDYIETLQGAGFKIHNPNAKKSCGCGQSFR